MVPSRSWVLAVALVGSSGVSIGCARTRPAVEAPVVSIPARIDDLDAFAVHLDTYTTLGTTDAARPQLRGVLIEYLGRYADEHLAAGTVDEAAKALEYAAALYRPSELRSTLREPRIAAAAERVFRAAARRGRVAPSLFALAIVQAFADPSTSDRTLARWKSIEAWVVEHGDFSEDPVLRHEELEQQIEQVAAAFPSAFVTKRLADLYLARYQAAKQGLRDGHDPEGARRRAEITGYFLIRAYLRADDLSGALAALDRIELDLPTRKLREFVLKAASPAKTAGALLTLANQFTPEEGENSLPQVFTTQGWGIVENLSRRAALAYPSDPFPRLLLAQSLATRGLVEAAAAELRVALELREDVFETWDNLATLEHESLDRVASTDPDSALARLPALERFHERARVLWADRPIEPTIVDAYFSVANGLYGLGRVDEADAILHKAARLEARPMLLDLMGTIARKRGRLADARGHYLALLDRGARGLPGRRTDLKWSARAHEQLAQIAWLEGDDARAVDHSRQALRNVHRMLELRDLTPDDRAGLLVERGQLLFELGDIDLGLADLAAATTLPTRDAQAASDALLFLVVRGYYDEAREIYHRVLAEPRVPDSLKVYFSLWIVELAARQHKETDPRASRFLATYAGENAPRGWERQLVLHSQGRLSYEQLLKSASDSGERAEAYFYEALRRWQAGGQEAARELFRKVLATQRMGFVEYDMARVYLDWNEVPAAARQPRHR